MQLWRWQAAMIQQGQACRILFQVPFHSGSLSRKVYIIHSYYYHYYYCYYDHYYHHYYY